jgi:hypothetical protein
MNCNNVCSILLALMKIRLYCMASCTFLLFSSLFYNTMKHKGNFFLISWGGVRLGMSALISLLYLPWMINEYGAFGGMRTGRWNQSTRRKPALVPLCPPQIPHGLTWYQTQATAVGSQQLTAWAMAQPSTKVKYRGIVLEVKFLWQSSA